MDYYISFRLKKINKNYHRYIFFFCHKFKSRKLNNFILCVNIISASSSSSQKYYVSSLKDANNIDLIGKVT